LDGENHTFVRFGTVAIVPTLSKCNEIVGVAPEKQQGKNKSTLQRAAKAKQKREREHETWEENVLSKQKAATDIAADPAKRARKVKKVLRQID